MNISPFHISIAVSDLEATKEFYVYLLGCSLGRTAHNWMDINFFGHQLTAQLAPAKVVPYDEGWQSERKFPIRHFGAILSPFKWAGLLDKLEARKTEWIIPPQIYFEGEVGEQRCMFIRDPDGYAIEFKSFEQTDNIFRKNI